MKGGDHTPYGEVLTQRFRAANTQTRPDRINSEGGC